MSVSLKKHSFGCKRNLVSKLTHVNPSVVGRSVTGGFESYHSKPQRNKPAYNRGPGNLNGLAGVGQNRIYSSHGKTRVEVV